MKNRKNDRSDASLHVDHLGDVRGSRYKSPSSHQGGYHKKTYIYHGIGLSGQRQNAQSVV